MVADADRFLLVQELEQARAKLGTLSGLVSEVAASSSKARLIGLTPAAFLGDLAVNDFRAAVEKLERQLAFGS